MLRTCITAVLVALAPAAAAAQTCLGVASQPDESAFAGQLGVTDGATLYGVQGSFHLPRHIALVARFQLARPDEGDDITMFGGSAAWTVPGSQPSLCPIIGVEYASWLRFTQLWIPVGISLGVTLPARSVQTTLYAMPQFVWRRLTYDPTVPGGGGPRETDTGVTGTVGVNLSRGVLFGGMAGQFATLEGYDPRFIVQLGVILGGGEGNRP